FFSSRRRHTRFDCDWSSDVCSSDLSAHGSFATPVGAALYDGQPALCLMVGKLPWADTPRLTERVEAALVRLDAELPAGTVRHQRSEERRVGKECRAGGGG